MTRYVCVAGALLALDGTFPDDVGEGVVDTLLLALDTTTAPAGGTLADALAAQLTMLGWPVRSASSTSTTVPARRPALERAEAGVDFVAAALRAVATAPDAVRAAFAGFGTAAGTTAATTTQRLLAQAVGDGSAPVLTLVHLTSTPGDTGFPWTAAADATTLTRQVVVLTADPAVWTAGLRAQIAGKVAGVVARDVLPLT